MNKLSAEDRAQLKGLAERPDDTVDLSDVPEFRDIPAHAVRRRMSGEG